MPSASLDIYQTRTNAATSGASGQLTGQMVPGGATVDEIDLGAGNALAGAPGAGHGRQLYLHAAVASASGTGSVTLALSVETADDVAFTVGNVTRFTTPTLTTTTNATLNASGVWALPALPQRYARINFAAGGTAPVFNVTAALGDRGDSRFVDWGTRF